VTTPEWAPQRRITPELAAAEIARQFPELADLPVTAFDAGWDNAVLAVGDRWLFRFVHREIALDGSRRELSVLGSVTGLPLPVPRPTFVGRPSRQVPWPFWGAERLPGVGLAESGLPLDRRGPVAEALGGFLRALHDPARLGEVGDLPVDPIGRGDPARQAERAERRLTSLAADGSGTVPDRAADLLARSQPLRRAAAALDPGEGRVLVHGDLHARHLLVDGERPSGVIDWGDTAIADPAVDLIAAWAAFGPEDREVFWAAYGPASIDRRLRARVTALHVCTALAAQAAADGQRAVLAEALAGAERACADD
jgi:aminoglycoside phosphotransferase (APT) family kinase protein